jgi:hypothetical protein
VAARRLIAILLVLLFLTSLATALAPVQNTSKSVSSTTSSTESTAEAPPTESEPEPEPSSRTRLIDQTIVASTSRPMVVRARVGDQLRLTVTSDRSGTIELAGLGSAEDIGTEQPAYFDVILRDKGSFPVQFLGEDREVARIRVTNESLADAKP